jgi:hypothetical protein
MIRETRINQELREFCEAISEFLLSTWHILVHGIVVELHTVDQALHCPRLLQARTRQ